MRLRLLLTLAGGFLLLTAQAQKTKKSTAFAITGSEKGSSNWSEVRLVDISNGEELQNIYKPTQEPSILNARTGKAVVKKDNSAKLQTADAAREHQVEEIRNVEGDKVVVVRKVTRTKAPLSYDKPFATKSAAMAYDKKHERLYYTPMGINQLRFIDLKAKTPKIYYFEEEPFGVLSGPHDIPNQITRMVIAADGNGYALTNDAKHLI